MERAAPASTKRTLLLLFLVALAVRAAMALWLPQEVIWPDGIRYEKIALNLIEGRGFGDLIDNHLSVPTQPLLIAAVYSIFGKSYLVLRLVSAVIGAASCVVGFLLARTLFGSIAAIFTGLLLAFYPHLVYVSALFEYPQTLAIFLVGIFLLIWVRFADDPRIAPRFLTGALLGTLILTLPSLLIFAPVFLLLLFRRGCSWRRNAGYVAAALAGLALTVGAWTWRNYVAYGHVVVVNAASGVNFWVANNETYARYGKRSVVPACAEGYEWTSYCHEHRAVLDELRRRDLQGTPRVLEHERMAWEHGLRYMREYPLAFTLLAVKKFARLWSPWPDAVHTGPARGGAARDVISALAYLPVLLLSLVGLVLSAREGARRLVPIYVFMVMFVAPFAIFLPTMRYRLPIDFLLIVFASVPLARLWSTVVDAHKRQRTERQARTRQLDSTVG
ncbi:MAG TPA: glycosyltransferase family 39 protein [Steroidobacteraceae bacterium]|nr:glycosyltransferase family 39 protein [Steroidobacteraceae bacterium]